MKAPLYSTTGKKLKDVTLPSAVFAIKASPRLIAQVVRVYQDRTHQGTSKVKTRGEVSLTTQKWFRQKGTGRARHGAQSAPIFVGGGVAHGPKAVRPQSKKLTQKMRRQALLAALSHKATQNSVSLLSAIDKLAPKTKKLHALLQKINQNQPTLIVTHTSHPNLIKAAKNMPHVSLSLNKDLNALKVMRSTHLLFEPDALNLFTPSKLTKSTKKSPSTKK